MQYRELVGELDGARTSGALQARLICVFLLDFVVNVARPVDMVFFIHLEVPKSPIWENALRAKRIIYVQYGQQTTFGKQPVITTNVQD